MDGAGGPGRALRGGCFEIGRGRIRAGHHWPGAHARRSARPDRRKPGAPEAVAGRRGRAQDRLRREDRAAGTGSPGHRGARLRARHHAVRLPAGCRPRRRPARRAGAAASGPEARPRAGAACRYHAGDLPAARTGRRRARAAATLRHHRTAAGARAGAHGAHRHPHRPQRTEAPLGADGNGDRAPHRGDPRAGRAAFQHQLAAATGRCAVRGSEAARAGEIWQGQDDLHRRRRAGRAGARTTRSCARCWNTASSPS